MCFKCISIELTLFANSYATEEDYRNNKLYNTINIMVSHIVSIQDVPSKTFEICFIGTGDTGSGFLVKGNSKYVLTLIHDCLQKTEI